MDPVNGKPTGGGEEYNRQLEINVNIFYWYLHLPLFGNANDPKSYGRSFISEVANDNSPLRTRENLPLKSTVLRRIGLAMEESYMLLVPLGWRIQ